MQIPRIIVTILALLLQQGYAACQELLDTSAIINLIMSYHEIRPFEEGRAAVTDQARRVGYIDTSTGRLVVPCQYKYGKDYSGGLTTVEDSLGQSFILDREGKVVARLGKKTVMTNFHEGRAVYQDDYYDSQYGLIDTKGKVVVRPSYYDVGVRGFSDGLLMVKNAEGKYGYVDKNGKTVIACRYDEASNFSHGSAVVKQDDRFAIIDKTGHTVRSLDGIIQAQGFTQGLCAVRNSNLEWGFIGPKGEIVVPLQYDNVPIIFQNGYATVKLDDRYAVVDTLGKMTPLTRLKLIMPFSHQGVAKAYLPQDDGGSLAGVVDGKGKLVVPCKYDLCTIYDFGIIKAQNKDHYDFYNLRGELIGTRKR